MGEEIREASMSDTVFMPENGEKKLREIRSDRATYLRDHAVMAGLGMVVAALVLTVMGSDYVLIGSLGALLAMIVRGLWLYSEQMKFLWVLSNIRIVGPGGREVYLLELTKARRLLGDIQLVTRSGDKHLIKHVGDADAVLAEIDAARIKRAKRKGA